MRSLFSMDARRMCWVLEQALVQFLSCGNCSTPVQLQRKLCGNSRLQQVCLPGWFPFQTPWSCGAWPEPDKVLLKIYFFHSFPLGTEVLMTIYEIKIYVFMDLAYSKLQFILWLSSFQQLPLHHLPCYILSPYSSPGNSFGFVHLASRIIKIVYDSGCFSSF